MTTTLTETRWFNIETDDDIQVQLKSDWTLEHLSQIEANLKQANLEQYQQVPVVFSCGGLNNFDLSGAWVLYRQAQQLQQQGYQVSYEGFRATHFAFIDSLIDQNVSTEPPIAPRGSVAERIQQFCVDYIRRAESIVTYVGELIFAVKNSCSGRYRIRWKSIINQLDETGLQAVPIVAVMALMISIVLVYQGATQLAQFGADIYAIDLVVISVLREMGVLLTAIMVAGRSGSAFAAEIGVMKLNEEIDALRTMGIHPLQILVIPRLIALVIALPLLTLVANVAGFVGATIMSVTYLGLPFDIFILRLQDAFEPVHFWVGISKAPVFAAIIALLSTYQGLQVEQSAEDIGQYTTRAVVSTIFLVIIADAAFSVIYGELGL